MLSIAGLAGGAHDGATAGHAAGGAGIAEDGAEHAADEGPAHGANPVQLFVDAGRGVERTIDTFADLHPVLSEAAFVGGVGKQVLR